MLWPGLGGHWEQNRHYSEFFIRSDAGREDVFDLMVDDVEFYFPKFGFGVGKPN